MNKNILIIGYGIVGHNLEIELQDLHPDIVDKYKENVNTIRNIHYDIGFICVDTPLKEDKTLDISEVINCINKYDCEIYCIKSTCPVGTVEKLSKQTGKRIVFSPEYYGNTKNCNNYSFDFTILGGKKLDCEEVIQVLLPCYDGRHSFRIVEPKIAELAKFMENSFLSTKVSFCNSFYMYVKKKI
jgi:UDPglucose 6-dehydrogenase